MKRGTVSALIASVVLAIAVGAGAYSSKVLLPNEVRLAQGEDFSYKQGLLTVRTEKGSMQCTGPVHLVMDTENKGADKMMGGLKFATARGEVAVAGRDSTGRLLRASGDLLEIDSATGMKVLSGQKVTLGDAYNTHIASGPGACIRIDADNNASIHGKKHTTNATRIREQMEKEKSKKQPKK